MKLDSITKQRIERERYEKGYLSSPKSVPHSKIPASDFYPKNNCQDIKRPLKTNHQDLNFKGLSSIWYKKLDKVYDRAEFLEFAQKYVGKTIVDKNGHPIESGSGTEREPGYDFRGKCFLQRSVKGLLHRQQCLSDWKSDVGRDSLSEQMLLNA